MLDDMEDVGISFDDLSLVDELVRLSDGFYTRSSVLHSAIHHYYASVIAALSHYKK